MNITSDHEKFPQTLDSPRGGHNGSVMTLRELETSTVEKQRRELQILLTELKDRDRELNMMVAVHQHQLSSWDKDRHRALEMGRKSERFELELKKRNEQLRQLIHHIKSSDTKQKAVIHDLEVAQARIKQLEADASITSSAARDLEDKNASLNDSLTDLTSKVDNMESREQKLNAVISMKEREISKATSFIASLQKKIAVLESVILDNKRKENILLSDLKYERTRCDSMKSENECVKSELQDVNNSMLSCKCDILKLEEKIQFLQEDSIIKDDEVRRKDELISSQRSKQDRIDKEFAALRMVCENQREDMLLLQSKLEKSQKQQACMNEDVCDFEDCRSDATEDILEEARLSAIGNNVKPNEQDLSPIKLPTSPTSKLQKLLEESREMVYNLELATKSPLHRSSA